MANKNEPSLLWNGIEEDDFHSEKFIEEVDLAEYNRPSMTKFIANIAYARALPRSSDSLKPIHRRIIYAMYLMGAHPGTKFRKSTEIIGETMKLSPHGDIAIYDSMVNLIQPCKTAKPLIEGDSAFGDATRPEQYASPRYTEARISKYGFENFCEDIDLDCIIEFPNTEVGEPLSLPSKFPNLLVNGGSGIAQGHQFCVLSYHIDDIVPLCKRILKNPKDPDIYIMPNSPTGCDIVDSDGNLRDICDKGYGTIKLRSTIDIIDDGRWWILKVSNLPWQSSLTDIEEKIAELLRAKILPIVDAQDHSYQVKTKNNVHTVLDYRIFVDKAHDPYKIKNILYKKTGLERVLSINFKVVTESLTVGRMNMRNLVLAWIDERREYKRRLYNKRVSKIRAKIARLEILISLLSKNNLEKTISVIKNHTGDEAEVKLMELCSMSSYQAKQVIDLSISSFTKEKREKYIEEKEAKEKELKYYMALLGNESKIDEIISDELDDLKKYATDIRSNIVQDEKNIVIPNTDHLLVVTKNNLIKKLPFDKSSKKHPIYGNFKNGDYPTRQKIVNNLENIIFIDNLGRYSIIPVYDIDNTDASQNGYKIFNYTKLEGNIISMIPKLTQENLEKVRVQLNNDLFLITLSKNGWIKKTKIDELFEANRNKYVNLHSLKKGDTLVKADLLFESNHVVVYTKNGHYLYIDIDTLEVQSKGVQGKLLINELDEYDEFVGFNCVGEDDDHLLIISDKGYMKKIDLNYVSEPVPRKKASIKKLATVEDGDSIIFVTGIHEKTEIFVCTEKKIHEYRFNDIEELPNRSKGNKMIPIPLGNHIINIEIMN